MLIVHPNSVCDVCLEPYNATCHTPNVIPCGHVFCHSCLESLIRLACPLCRDRFQPEDVRKLHIDPTSSPTVAAPDIAPKLRTIPEARRFLNTVQGFIQDGAPQPRFRQLATEMIEWSKQQPPDMFEEIRIIMRLLLSVDQWFKKAHELEGHLRKANSLIEEGNGRVETAERELQEAIRTGREEMELAEQRYQELLAQSQDEKDTAYAVETSLREHLANVNKRVNELFEENDKLRVHAKFAGFDIQQLEQRVALPDIDMSAAPYKDVDSPVKDVKYCKEYLEPTPATTTIPFLSPLPIAVSISSPVSSFITFAPLPGEDPSVVPSTGHQSSQLLPKIDVIPARQRAPLQPSGLTRTRPLELQVSTGPSLRRASTSSGDEGPLMASPSSSRPSSSASSRSRSSVDSASDPVRETSQAVQQPAYAENGRLVVGPQGTLDEEEERARSRVSQLHDILSSPPPSAFRLSRQSSEGEGRFVPSEQHLRLHREASTDFAPRVGRDLASTSGRSFAGVFGNVAEFRSRAQSEASLTRPDHGLVSFKPSSSFSTARMSSSLNHRHEIEMPKRSFNDLHPRTPSEQPSSSRLGVSPPRPSDFPTQAAPVQPTISIHTSIQMPSTPLTSPTHSSTSHARPGLTHRESRRQVVSTASHAAQALEYERRKAEREREKERERFGRGDHDREPQQREPRVRARIGPSSTHPVVGSSGVYNSPATSLYRSASTSLAIGNGKGKMGVAPVTFS